MTEVQTSKTSSDRPKVTAVDELAWSQAALPALLGRSGRTALLLAATMLPTSGCVHVDKLEYGAGTNPQPIPVAPEPAEQLPEGPHWEKPILTGYERVILVKHGDLVEQGQNLVQYSERARQSVAYEVRRAELAVEEQASQLDRLRKLEPSKAVSQQEIHSAITVFEQAKLTLEQIEIRLADLEVRAPFRGRVRIDATSNSPSISVYPLDDTQARYFWPEGGQVLEGGGG